MLFLFQVTVHKPAEMTNTEFFKLWEQEAEAVTGALEAGILKAAYKVPGEPKIVTIVEVESFEQMDLMLQSLPIWKSGFAHLVEETSWTPLRPYANWKADLKVLANG